MNITFAPRGILQIDDARLVFRNFSGRKDDYNKEGERNFSVVIPNPELADKLQNDVNKYGVGWNVKIKPPREEGDTPFMYMKVKIAFNDRGPAIYLRSGDNVRRLDEESVSTLDNVDIQSVDLDIRPYDGDGHFGPFRTAYLHSMEVVQNIDRISARYASEEYPEE